MVSSADVEEANDLTQPLVTQNNQPTKQSLRDAADSGGSGNDDDNLTMLQNAINQTYKSTANLAKHLPTGTVLAFQVLVPICTEAGHCTSTDRALTTTLLIVCAFLCFVLCFSDCFRDSVSGKLRYGFATVTGLWPVDGLGNPAPADVAGKGLKTLDFVHAFTSLLVFTAVALLDKNTVSCFYPIPSKDTQQLLAVLPVGIGALGSALVVIFPNNRHGNRSLPSQCYSGC